MAKAMGRPLTSTLFGAFSGTTQGGGGPGEERPVRSAGPNDIAIMLGYANKVILVPGYGLAVAQAVPDEVATLAGLRGPAGQQPVLVTVPLGQVVLEKVAPEKLAPVMFAPVMFALVRFALTKTAPVRFALGRTA